MESLIFSIAIMSPESYLVKKWWIWYFPDISVDKESVCNARDLGSIPELGRSAGEGIGYPLQYTWASRVTQRVKNLLAMQETWVGKISWRREKLPTPVFWPGEFHGLYIQSLGSQRVGHDWATFTSWCFLERFT